MSCAHEPSAAAAHLRLLALAMLVAPVALGAATEPPAPSVHVDTARARAGFYQLSWPAQAGQGARFELQEAHTADFNDPRTVYRGADVARVMSGRRNGHYFYRVRASAGEAAGAWSAPLEVTVDHHSVARATSFFVAGLSVFLATLALIVTGARRAEV